MAERASERPIAVAIEVGGRRCFASALDWPGWSRAGRDEGSALEALAASASRYVAVLVSAGQLPPPLEPAGLEVTERLRGSAATDFGVPSAIGAHDLLPLLPGEAALLGARVAATWTTLDAAVAAAPPELVKGPRGGGRDRDAIVRHVLDAERAYARKLGLRLPEVAADDAAALAHHRGALAEALRRAPADAGPGPVWPVRYAACRIGWHVLDHAWEIEDRVPPRS